MSKLGQYDGVPLDDIPEAAFEDDATFREIVDDQLRDPVAMIPIEDPPPHIDPLSYRCAREAWGDTRDIWAHRIGRPKSDWAFRLALAWMIAKVQDPWHCYQRSLYDDDPFFSHFESVFWVIEEGGNPDEDARSWYFYEPENLDPEPLPGCE